MSQPFKVLPYSVNTLKQLLVDHSPNSPEAIGAKRHLRYFEEYFAHIDAKTIIVEKDYIDRDFLEDFSAYYVRCFYGYDRRCARFHFFQQPFTEKDFKRLLEGAPKNLTASLLQECYLGFIVVKPIPETVVGRTCLRTYDSDGNRRVFPVTREYPVNLYGISLKTPRTLAFQEQDQVAAACATSAMWSVFHGTGRLFQHHIPSPAAITQTAAEHIVALNRCLPNRGLNILQIADAIRKVGLEPTVLGAQDSFFFQATTYAYLRGHIPLLLVVLVTNPSQPTSADQDRHAVTVTGYSLGCSAPQGYGSNNFLLEASRIDKVYAHDDQVGPFARMNLLQQNILSTSSGGPHTHAVREFLFLPLYHKIRIPLRTVLDAVMLFDAFFEHVIHPQFHSTHPQRLTWDIYLTTVNDLKEKVTYWTNLDGTYKRAILCRSLPRFIWQASACCGSTPIMDLVFDATDIKQGHFLNFVIEHNVDISAALRLASQDPTVISLLSAGPAWKILEWFRP